MDLFLLVICLLRNSLVTFQWQRILLLAELEMEVISSINQDNLPFDLGAQDDSQLKDASSSQQLALDNAQIPSQVSDLPTQFDTIGNQNDTSQNDTSQIIPPSLDGTHVSDLQSQTVINSAPNQETNLYKDAAVERKDEFVPNVEILEDLEDSDDNLINDEELQEDPEDEFDKSLKAIGTNLNKLNSVLENPEIEEIEIEEEEEDLSALKQTPGKKKKTPKSSFPFKGAHLLWKDSSQDDQKASINALDRISGVSHAVAFGNSTNHKPVKAATASVNNLLADLGGKNFIRGIKIQMSNKEFRDECIQALSPDLRETISDLKQDLANVKDLLAQIDKIRPFLANKLDMLYKFDSVSTTKMGKIVNFLHKLYTEATGNAQLAKRLLPQKMSAFYKSYNSRMAAPFNDEQELIQFSIHSGIPIQNVKVTPFNGELNKDKVEYPSATKKNLNLATMIQAAKIVEPPPKKSREENLRHVLNILYMFMEKYL
jgi:hypothetical protein